MSIKYKEVEVQPLTQQYPHTILCDVCGKDAEVNKTRRPSDRGSNSQNWSRFEFVENNTEANPISSVLMFNEAAVTGIADLCNNCAIDVKYLILQLKSQHEEEDVFELRKPNKYGT